MISNQQMSNVLLRHWQLLWPLPAAERAARIDQIARDYEFEEQLRGVADAMAEPTRCDCPVCSPLVEPEPEASIWQDMRRDWRGMISGLLVIGLWIAAWWWVPA